MTPISSISMIVLGLLALASPCLFWFLVRGRPHRITPACPRCQYCVSGSSSSTCPECGNDLSISGVYLNGRRRIPRGIRVLIFVPIILLLMPAYAQVTDGLWTRVAAELHGKTIELAGQSEVRYTLFPDKSRYSRIRVIYPDPIMVPPSPVQGPVTTWVSPQPIRLSMTQDDGSRRDYRIRSISEDYSTWDIQRIAPLGGSIGNNIKPKQPLEGPMEDLAILIAKRIRQDEPAEVGEDRGPLLASAITMRQVETMLGVKPPLELHNTFVVDGGFADLRMTSYYHPAVIELPVQRVGPYWLVVSSWTLLWLILLTILVIPGTRTDPWEPEGLSQAT